MKLKELKLETNPTVEWKVRRGRVLRCSYCPPHKVENSRQGNKHYQKGWKVKTKQRRQFKIL